jgi:hypothetical protein
MNHVGDPEGNMSTKHFEQNRYFLKDSIRQRVDFSATDQSRGKPAPPLQKPCPPDVPRIQLPDGRDTLDRLGRLSLGEAITRRTSVRRFSADELTLEELSFLCQNLYLACQGIGAGTCAIAAYDQDACDRLLGVDGDEEFTIYIAPVGKR